MGCATEAFQKIAILKHLFIRKGIIPDMTVLSVTIAKLGNNSNNYTIRFQISTRRWFNDGSM